MVDGNQPTQQPQPPANEPRPADVGAVPGLSDADAAILDALLDARRSPWTAAPVPAAHAERAQRIAALLDLMDQDPVGGAPADLAQRTLARVRAHEQRLRFSQQIDMLREPRRGLGFDWRQFLSAAALFVLGLSLVMPVLDRTRADASRVACAANLGLAGQAFASYAADFAGVLPRLSVRPGSEWYHVGQPNGTKDGAVKSNSAHLYLLYRAGYASPQALYCPANEHTTPAQMNRQRDDWADARSVSFSYQNQYTDKPIRIEMQPGLALLADKNPMFTIENNGGRITLKLNDAGAQAPSRSHGSRGQNILLSDGSVQWTLRPVIARSGDAADNVWTLPDVDSYNGTETPITLGDRIDSFLVP